MATEAQERGIIIHIGNSKGGVAKSTICENIGAELARLGYSVAMVDADTRQKTLTKWAERRNASIEAGAKYPYLFCCEKSGRIRNDVIELAKNYDFVVIDTGGRETAELRAGLMAADIIYVPMQVSINDTEALQELSKVLDDTEDYNPDRKVFGMIVRTPTHPNSTEKKDAIAFLKKWNEYMDSSRQTTTESVAYRKAAKLGAGVVELPSNKVKGEIQVLVQEILKHV